MANEYLEHEKLQKIQEQSQLCGEFLEWLSGQGYVLARWGEDDLLYSVRAPRDKLLAEFFEIDLDKLEQEKQQLLEEQRQLNRTP